MKKFEWNFTSTSLTAIIFYGICGLLLLVLPSEALAIANYAIAAILAVAGVISIISYFRASVVIGRFSFQLAIGLALLSFGVLLFCYPTFLAQLLPAIWGLSLLVGGFGKIQASADLKRFGDAKWWIMLIGALLSFVLGVLSLANPIYIAQTIFVFIGICLLAEAALDLASFIVIRKRVRRFQKEQDALNQTLEV